MAAVRAHLRHDWEGWHAVLNQAAQPRIALGMCSIALSDLIAAIDPPLDDEGRERFLAEIATRITNALLDVLGTARSTGGG